MPETRPETRPEILPTAGPPAGSKPRRALLGLAARLAWRDWRGGELRLLLLALVLAVASVSGIALFTDRLEKALALESANILAADRVLGSSQRPPPEILREAAARGLRVATTLSFTSMAFGEADSMLVAAKAVSDAYPLRGEVIVSAAPFTRGQPAAGGPPPGEAWLEARALAALGVAVGDQVALGEADFRVGAIVVAEPDRQQGGLVDNVGPRLLLNLADVERTRVVQPGSRVRHRYLFAGDDSAALDGFEAWVDDRYQNAYRIRDVREESEEVAEALATAENFLLLGSLFAVLLAGVAIALTARRYAERHYDYVAILKTLGCTTAEVTFIYLAILSWVALGAVALGSAVGFLLHEGILLLLGSLLAVALPAASYQPFAVGALTAVICLLSCALPPLLALRSTPPLRVLRKNLHGISAGARAAYGCGGAGALALALWYSESLALTAVLAVSVTAIALALAAASWLLLRGGAALGMRAGNAWLLAMTGIRRRRRQNVLQVMVFSLTLMALLTVTLLRTDLIGDWRAQLPDNTPNHFMMNITADQIAGIEGFFAANGIAANAFYPLISARVTGVNGRLPAPAGSRQTGGGELGGSTTMGMGRDAEPGGEPAAGAAAGAEGGNAATRSGNRPATLGDAGRTDQGTASTEREDPATRSGSGPAAPGDTGTTGEGTAGESTRVQGRLGRRQVTWATYLPPDNRVTAGEWWPAAPLPGYVSIEREYAEWLNLELGDRLEFEINRQTVTAEVASFRSVRWDNMQPNFFIIFSPGTIDHLGGTFLSTALLAPAQKMLLNDLVRQFPTVVIIEVDALIEQIQTIIDQVSAAVELIFLLVLACGALVLLATVAATLDERFRENAILRALGAGRGLILASLTAEFAVIGLVAGIIATAGAEGVLFYLQEEIFQQDFRPHYWTWLAGPALGTALIAALGVGSTRRVVSASPLAVLRAVA